MKIIVLGCGLVGMPMAVDLFKDKISDVTIADNNKERLGKIKTVYNIKTILSDLSDTAVVKKLVSDYDMVVNALPGFMGFQTLKAVIETGKDVVDISFFPEDPAELDLIAKQNNITAIMDCGVAPGMSNILIGYSATQLDIIDNVLIYVGGLPKTRHWPWEYKAVFSPADVIEEYTRPARYVENGKVVIREALSDAEFIEFESTGTLEAFNSDGLRSLIFTIKGVNMKEKTLRYPGHIDKIKVLRETGFFSKDKIDFNGVQFSPLDFTSRILFPLWQMKEQDRDITVMKIIVEGQKKQKFTRFTFDLVDEYDEMTDVHSMARTTGYTATMAVRMIENKLFERKGLIYPEYIGESEDCVNFILNGLAERNIVYKKTVSS
jgi:lysine 6-dehydrogenase